MNTTKISLKIVKGSIPFSSLEVGSSFTYNLQGTELLCKVSATTTYHLNMQKKVKVHPDTLVHKIYWS